MVSKPHGDRTDESASFQMKGHTNLQFDTNKFGAGKRLAVGRRSQSRGQLIPAHLCVPLGCLSQQQNHVEISNFVHRLF